MRWASRPGESKVERDRKREGRMWDESMKGEIDEYGSVGLRNQWSKNYLADLLSPFCSVCQLIHSFTDAGSRGLVAAMVQSEIQRRISDAINNYDYM